MLDPKIQRRLVESLELRGFKMHESIYPLVYAAFDEGLAEALDIIECHGGGVPRGDPAWMKIHNVMNGEAR